MAFSKPVHVVNDLENRLTCTECLDTISEPKTLPCLHSFCLKCIVRVSEKCMETEEEFACPECKLRIRLPSGGPSMLPSSMKLESLLPLLKAMEGETHKEGNRVPECFVCDDPTVLLGFCEDCRVMICQRCVTYHKTLKLFRGHKLTMFYDFKPKTVDTFLMCQSFCKLKFHERNKLELFCQDPACKLCICKQCALLYHRNHDVICLQSNTDPGVMEKYTELAKQNIRDEITSVSQLEEKYGRGSETSKRRKAKYVAEFESILRNVDEVMVNFNRKVQQFRTGENHCCREICDECKEESEKMQE